MALEIELKLRLAPEHAAALLRHPLVRRGANRVTRRLYGVYYDTPGLDLWRAGVTFRLRREGRDWMQTVKAGGGVTGGLHERYEFESKVPGQSPDFAALAASDIAAHFSAQELRANLQPLFVTDFARTSCLMQPASGVVIELALDRGAIVCGETVEPLCELELEMKAGPAWRAHQLALMLIERVPLLVEDRSKAERGIALHLKLESKPVKSGRSLVRAGMLTNDVFKTLIAGCLAQYTANQRGMLDAGDPEYLHQMRVALRRLRSVFSTFASLFPPEVLAPPVAEMRWLGGILGEARDWDVFATETLPPIEKRYAKHAGLAALVRASSRQRTAANRRARNAAASPRGQSLLLGLSAWIAAETWREALDDAQMLALHRPGEEFACAVLEEGRKRVMKRGRNFSALAPHELHRLRISAKKLRYATEFFSPLFDDKPAADYRDALARLQDALGSYNDAVKMTQFAERASAGLKSRAVNEARGILLGWGAGIQDAGTRYLKRIWKDFRTAKPFWK